MAKRILFCGGGTMGHLAPALAVYEAVRKKAQIEAFVICSDRPQETETLHALKLRFAVISAPKFPNGLSLSWLTFWILFPYAFLRSYFLVAKEQPHLVFSKGGFISVPVCLAAMLQRIPIVLHESDAAIGLANRLFAKRAKAICRGFPGATLSSKEIFTGNPVRSSVTHAKAADGLLLTGFSGKRPIIMITGGSQGAEALNRAVDHSLDALLSMADIIHLTGPGKAGGRKQHARYFVREFVTDELASLYQISTIVVTRGGAGSLAEIAYFKKPAVVVPIVGLANDHQVKNATVLADHDAAVHLPQRELDALPKTLLALLQNPKKCQELGLRLHELFPVHAAQKIADVLLDVLSKAR